jgi:hypothetical protein
MRIFTPDDEIEKLFYALSKHRTMYTDDVLLARRVGHRYKDLIDRDILDIAYSHKKRRTWFIVPSDVQMVHRSDRKYEFIKLF